MSWPRCRCASKMCAPSGISRASSASHCSTSSHARPRASTRGSLDMVRRMPDVLMYADTFRSPELRHEVPLGVPDPFLYAETGGAKHIAIGAMEIPRLAELGLFELHPSEEFGYDDLIREGRSSAEIKRTIPVRAVQTLGITTGVEPAVDGEFFDERRRVKTEAELAGIRRAQRAAEQGMDAARDMLRRATRNGDGSLELEGGPLTVERVKSVMSQVFAANGATADDFIVAPGPQGAVGHDMGSGPIRAGVPIVIDIWPRDTESFCFCDMTRTFVVGDVADDVREWHRLAKEAIDRALAEIRDGVGGREIFEGAGQPTQRTKEAGKPLADGFFHGLGHGVGLEVHEQPGMGIASNCALRTGDVVTIEPGCYRQGYGGVRLEDLVLVTADGAENLTQYPYDLEP